MQQSSKRSFLWRPRERVFVWRGASIYLFQRTSGACRFVRRWNDNHRGLSRRGTTSLFLFYSQFSMHQLCFCRFHVFDSCFHDWHALARSPSLCMSLVSLSLSSPSICLFFCLSVFFFSYSWLVYHFTIIFSQLQRSSSSLNDCFVEHADGFIRVQTLSQDENANSAVFFNLTDCEFTVSKELSTENFTRQPESAERTQHSLFTLISLRCTLHFLDTSCLPPFREVPYVHIIT